MPEKQICWASAEEEHALGKRSIILVWVSRRADAVKISLKPPDCDSGRKWDSV